MNEAVAARQQRRSVWRLRRIARLIALLLPRGAARRGARLAISRRASPVRDVLLAALAARRGDRARALAFTGSGSIERARTLTLLAALAIAISGAIGVYHAGVEAKIFEGLHPVHRDRQGR